MVKKTDRARAVRRARERVTEAKANRPRVGPKRGRDAALMDLRNPAALGAEIRRQIARLHGGSSAKAAVAVGMPKSTLDALVAGSRQRVTLRTFVALGQLLPENRAMWGSLILPKDGQFAFVAYKLWIRSWFNRMREEKGAGEAVTVGVPGLVWRGLEHERNVLLDRVRRVAPEVLNDLYALANDRRFLVDRLALALFRTLEPLLDAHSSGGVERHHSELDDQELRKFVKAGFDREMILLLPRSGDVERAQAAEPISVGPAGATSIADEIDRELRSRENPGEPRTVIEHAIHALTPEPELSPRRKG